MVIAVAALGFTILMPSSPDDSTHSLSNREQFEWCRKQGGAYLKGAYHFEECVVIPGAKVLDVPRSLPK